MYANLKTWKLLSLQKIIALKSIFACVCVCVCLSVFLENTFLRLINYIPTNKLVAMHLKQNIAQSYMIIWCLTFLRYLELIVRESVYVLCLYFFIWSSMSNVYFIYSWVMKRVYVLGVFFLVVICDESIITYIHIIQL